MGAVAVVCALTIAGLVVHTFLESKAPQVDATSVLLLAVLLFAPFIRHLRALEFGGAKAEFQDNASTGLIAVLEAVRAEHDAISRIYADITSQGRVEDDPQPVAAAERHIATATSRPARLLRRLVWVDDRPEGNSYELKALGRLFDLTVARTTEKCNELLSTGRFDGVISDIVRWEGGQPDYHAGLDVVVLAAALNPALPVFVYSSEDSVRIQAQDLTDAGAIVVTSSYVDLVRAIRQQARADFDTVVRNTFVNVLGQGAVEEQVDDIDYVLDLGNGHRLAVETPHWLSAPKLEALQGRYDKLSRAMSSWRSDGALLVMQRNLLRPEQRSRAPEGVRVLVADDLAAHLRSLKQDAERTDPSG